MFCPKCGHVAAESDDFCIMCGTPLAERKKYVFMNTPEDVQQPEEEELPAVEEPEAEIVLEEEAVSFAEETEEAADEEG